MTKIKSKIFLFSLSFPILIFAFSIMFAHAEAPTTGLVGYWPIDEGSDTIANDMSGNNNNRTINGATWVAGRACPVASSCSATGVGNGALSFDGVDNQKSGKMII